jgi:hypothetical protein
MADSIKKEVLNCLSIIKDEDRPTYLNQENYLETLISYDQEGDLEGYVHIFVTAKDLIVLVGKALGHRTYSLVDWVTKYYKSSYKIEKRYISDISKEELRERIEDFKKQCD